MLNSHPDLAIPEESHFMYQLARRRALGRWPATLQTAAAWKRWLDYLERHPFLAYWSVSPAGLRERLDGLPDRSHASAFHAIFTSFMEHEQKSRWGDKTPMHVQYMLLLDCWFPSAKFVHVLRDGRDVALSLLDRAWGPRHIALAGYYWKWLVLSGMVSGALLGPNRYREVHYEDLVTCPESTLRSLCEWLELDYTPALLLYHATQAAQRYARSGKVAQRLAGPPDPQRIQRWVHSMCIADQKSVLRQAGSLLAFLGYQADKLPRSQQREYEAIGSLLQPTTVAALGRSAPGKTGSEIRLRSGLLIDRLLQSVHFFCGNLEGWARAGIRWQRTVAGMLQ
jgi:hypothetical protein